MIDVAPWDHADPSGIPWLFKQAIGLVLVGIILLLSTPVRRCEMEAEAEMDAEDQFFR